MMMGTTRNGSGAVYTRPNSNTAQHSRTSLDIDVDDAKYNKKKRKKSQGRRFFYPHHHPRSFSTYSLPHVVGLLLVLASLWVLWQYTHSALESKRHQDNQMRRHRAKRLFQQRNYDAPHYHDRNKESSSSSKDDPQEENEIDQNLQADEYEELFSKHRKNTDNDSSSNTKKIRQILKAWLQAINQQIRHNVHGGQRWIRPYLLPPLPDDTTTTTLEVSSRHKEDRFDKKFFRVERTEHLDWEKEWETLEASGQEDLGPAVDYTQRDKYHYPAVLDQPPSLGYPQLKSLQAMMKEWHQDEDYTKPKFAETLVHFNYSDPSEREAARRFRDAELPFKLYDIPEIDAASIKWTDDDYVANHFGDGRLARANSLFRFGFSGEQQPKASGMAQESVNNFFAFFVSEHWDVERMGLAPVRVNKWSFAQWAKHARYADAVRLNADQPHFYWQAGVDREERYQAESKWTFISKDLPSFSSPTETFFVFHPEEQKGIQCRFGERGVVAATHYDSGRNMVAMITGAKRYILSPPNQCSKLGIFTRRKSPIYRHSLLNFGHLKYMDDPAMSAEERAWLERAATSQAVETVLKKGEVLYIPSFWFHYIVSIQKSAQCNVRSGMDHIGTPEFGGQLDVLNCGPKDDSKEE